jgi:hypothetical protein
MSAKKPSLETILTPEMPSAIRDQLPKTERVTFLVSTAEKREMQALASAFGLTLTSYFARLHRLTAAIHGAKKRRR